MTKLRVVTWNAEGMFAPFDAFMPVDTPGPHAAETRRATAHNAIAVVKALDADLIVVPEFGTVGYLRDTTRIALESLGYQIAEFAYDDEYMPPIEMAVLSRLPIEQSKMHRLGGIRTVGEVIVRAGRERVRVLAVHLDDKNEQNRLRQAEDLVTAINTDDSTPLIVLGDFNAMYRGAWFARLNRLSASIMVTRSIRHKRIKSIMTRLHDMALGTTIQYVLSHTTLHNLDSGHHLTISAKQAGLEWMPAIRLAKIDWMFGNRHIETISYRVLPDSGSDHRPVVAELNIL